MAPSGDVHEEVTRLLLGTSGRRVQRLIDSTAKERGPAHRQDPVHSLAGVCSELAKRGELTAENIQVAALHIATDRAFDEAWKRLPIRGPAREPVKHLIQSVLVRSLKRRRRR